ncbi:MAG: Dyp-type peroxidase [Actinomycetota bacterium]
MTGQPKPPTGEPTGSDRATPRRAFLAGAGAAALAGLGVACTTDDDDADALPGDALPGNGAATIDADRRADPVAFRSTHQQGVLQAPAAAGAVVAFDVTGTDRTELGETLQLLSTEIERIMTGAAPTDADEILPPPDSGIVDQSVGSAGTAITLALGSSLFDERFGLADRRPAELIPMPRFFNDRLVQPDRSDGDLAVVISSPSPQASVYAMQQLVRVTGRRLRLRWAQEGYNDLLPPSAGSVAPTRNLMGFRDGTSNLDTTDAAVMNEHVWVQRSDGEPDWAVGGTYLAVRTIRMLIEFWSTAALVRQEQIFGRHRDSGAPLGQAEEGEEPRFADDQSDLTIPRQSHIRRANPRTPGTGRILRRGFSYLNGADQSGTLDQGLLFLSYQRSLSRGFLAVQRSLDGEPMEDYVKPVGGGLFFVPPGPGDGTGWLAQDLLA